MQAGGVGRAASEAAVVGSVGEGSEMSLVVRHALLRSLNAPVSTATIGFAVDVAAGENDADALAAELRSSP